MDVFAASENTFSAAHLSKPKRIVDIPTHAPVQTRHDEAEFSSGTFTFPATSPWKDRFIVWRATGTLLTLEERSIRHSVIDSCIAFNFSRAPIVPGTTISLLSNLLSIVVTTQSSVHRFLCRLAVDESDDDSDSVESTLSQLLDVATSKDIMRTDFHDVHQLSARSTPSRAAVAVRPADTRVAVGLSDGQMVIVLMANIIGGKTEELPISEAGFMQRFVGKTMTGLMDLCTLEDGRNRSEPVSEVDFTPFYTVNKDGTIRIVNGETYHTALSVPWSDYVSVDGEVLNASIRWRGCGEFGLIVVSITTAEAVHFVLLRDLERQQFVVVATAYKRTRSRIVDFGVHEMAGRDTARLWIVACIAPPEMGREGEEEGEGKKDEDSFVRLTDTYTLEYMDLPLPSNSSIRSGVQPKTLYAWKRVRGMGETIAERKALHHQLRLEASMNGVSAAAPTNTKESVQLLRKEIFNVENHHFDVVLRATKITSDNPAQFRVDHNDWTGLMTAVDGYIRSAEFERKFGSADWQTTSIVGTRDVRSEGELRFYRALSSSCAEIARSLARPLGLFVTPLAGTHLIGVIQETRLTVVVDACGELMERLNEEQREALDKALKEAVKVDKDPVASPKAKDSKRCKLQRMNSDEDSLSEAVALFVRRSKGLLSGERGSREEGDESDERMEHEYESNSSSDNSPTSMSSDQFSDDDCNSPYGGSFASGLIASLIRSRIVVEHKIASTLLMGIEKKRICLEDYATSLKDIVQTLSVLAAQLDIHVERDAGGWDSLAGWLFSSQALPLLRIEGGYEIDVNMSGDEDEERPPLHLFINRSVMAVLSAIHPLSPTQSIPKLLAAQDKNDTMKVLYSFWGEERLPAPLKYVVPYYTGIALSGTGMPRKALDQFKEAANGMRMGDKFLRRALVSLAVIRSKRLQEEAEIGIGVFYVNVIKVLNEHGHQQEVIDMSRESMNNLPEGSHLASINATLFKRQVDGEQWSEALATIESTLDPSLRRHLLHELLSRLLHAGQWQIIIGADFAANTNMVESIIINHARSLDVVSANPHPFELVASFHVCKGNYYQAALVQYELAVGLRNAPMSPEILTRCKRAVTLTLTMLDLMPEHKRFIAFPHIAEFSSGKRKTMMIVKYDELKREWIMLRGRCALLNAVHSSIPPDEPIALIKALTRAKMYATAIEMCIVLDEDPSAVIEDATTAAIKIDVSGEELMPAWVGTNRRLAHKKEKNEHWSIVRALVKECRSRWRRDERSLRAALKAFLAHDIPLPYWLHAKFSKNNVGGYCRLLIDYGGSEAVDTALAVLHDCYKREADRIVDASTRTCLPHTVTEQVMEVARKEKSTETRMLLDKLDSVVRIHQQRATSFAKFT